MAAEFEGARIGLAAIEERGAPPAPEGYARWVHRGPAVAQGAIPGYLVDGKRAGESFEESSTSASGYMEVDRLDGTDRTDGCDVVVIGSGAGGAAAAAELSRSGLRVVVLEEGAYFTRDDFKGPPLERVFKLYAQAGSSASLGRTSIPIPYGKTVGGTTTINSGTCFRAPRKVLNDWQVRLGIEGIDYESLDPFFTEVESTLKVKPVPWELLGPTGWVTHYGAEALGLTGGPILRNIDSCHGTGQCAFGCPTDAKQAMHLSYLPDAWRNGARIYEQTKAQWIELERGRVTGVVARAAGKHSASLRIRCRAVFVACGAIGTPVLLSKNKICNSSRQLGRNLRIHPATGVAGWFDKAIYGWRGTLQPYYVDSLFDSHDVLMEATNSVPSVGASLFAGTGHPLKDQLATYPNVATLGLLVSDTSRGSVFRGPRDEPMIFYSLNKTDLSNIYAGLSLAAKILLAAGAVKVTAGARGFEEIVDFRQAGELADAQPRAAGLKLSAFHPMGTARMSVDPLSGVVDSWLETHDVAGLHITDASVFPSCIGVNPQITIMALATRAARRVAERLV